MTVPYNKPWLSYNEQLQLLKNRGLLVGDDRKAEQFLSHVNYYRISGYCLAFEKDRHAFQPGTTFDQIIAAYHFDVTLRDLLTEALEVVEVDLRTKLAYEFGNSYGAFGHIDASNFYSRFDHLKWLTRLQEEADRSSELFIKHFKATYDDFPNLPVWTVTEVMSFGGLSRMFQGMTRKDKAAIASRYGLQPAILESWMHHVAYVRNLCAHHSRVWDRSWSIKPTTPHGRHWKAPFLPGNGRLFVTLLLLRYLLKRIPAESQFANDWKHRIENHVATPPAVIEPSRVMGLAADWSSNRNWK